MALIPPFFLDCVVAVGFDVSPGKREYLATGFLYGKFASQKGEQKMYGVYLVTNKHVFGDHATAWVRLNPEADEPAQEFKLLLIDGGTTLWRAHPDEAVDLAVVRIDFGLLQKSGIRASFFQSDSHVLTRAKAQELGVSEGDGVFVLGFPMGLVGGNRNYVIVKQGALARVRDALAGSTKDFLVDTSIFPGNSGGPVVTRPEVVSITGTKSINAAHLIGVVAAYLPYRDIAISAQTKRPRIIFEENSGLASVVPVDFIEDLVEEMPEPPAQEEAKVSIDQVPSEGPKPSLD